MSSASYDLAPGYTMTGTTSGNSTAPINYSVNGISVGVPGPTGFDYEYFINKGTSNYTVRVNGVTVGTAVSLDTADSIVASLRPAKTSITNSINEQAKVAAPTPAQVQLPTAELKVDPVPVTVNTVTLDANGKPVTTPTTINEPSPIRDPGPLVINPTPVTVNVATIDGTGNVVTKPVTIDTVTNTAGGSTGPGTSSKYTVQKGDTLSSIAKKYGVTVAELLKANPQIKDPNLIKVGEVITIPGKPGAANVAPTTGNAAPSATTPPSGPPTMGLSGNITSAAGAATAQDQANFAAKADWRVRLSLAPGTNYLYNASDPGILQPLKDTDGVIFPYTPAISVNYAANYEGTSLTHTNYKIFQYQNSSVDQVQLTCEFTAQDVKEANYVLAVIHFFRSMTKMFYGQDKDPKNGTPPPLCYLFGMGGYQFDALPLAISGFSYSLPQDVDYIKTTGAAAAGTPQPSVQNGATNSNRLGDKIGTGGAPAKPNYGTTTKQADQSTTWIPTKINLSITCLPIMSRNQVSNYFSLRDYATGNLLLGTKRPGGGMW